MAETTKRPEKAPFFDDVEERIAQALAAPVLFSEALSGFPWQHWDHPVVPAVAFRVRLVVEGYLSTPRWFLSAGMVFKRTIGEPTQEFLWDVPTVHAIRAFVQIVLGKMGEGEVIVSDIGPTVDGFRMLSEDERERLPQRQLM